MGGGESTVGWVVTRIEGGGLGWVGYNAGRAGVVYNSPKHRGALDCLPFQGFGIRNRRMLGCVCVYYCRTYYKAVRRGGILGGRFCIFPEGSWNGKQDRLFDARTAGRVMPASHDVPRWTRRR